MKKLIIAATLAALPALAHHGWSEYDQAKPLTLTGKVVESGYEHPHGHIKLETPGKTWLVVLAPPSRMQPTRPSTPTASAIAATRAARRIRCLSHWARVADVCETTRNRRAGKTSC